MTLEHHESGGLMERNEATTLSATADPSEVLVLEADVVIPADLARPIVYASQLMLVTALFAGLSGMYVFMSLSIGLWFTSTNFWRDPRLGYRRLMDYTMVAAILCYGTVVAIHQPLLYSAGWFVFMGLLALIFGGNETRFWLNNAKTKSDYKSVVCVHLTGVHIVANVAAWWLLYGIHKSGNTCCQ